MDLDSILEQTYVGQSSKALMKLKEHGLDKVFSRSIQYLHTLLRSKRRLSLGVVTSSHLVNINEVIGKIDDHDEKELIKTICADVSKEMLLQLIKKSNLSASEVLGELKQNLIEIMEYNGFDSNDFKRYLDIEYLAKVIGFNSSTIFLSDNEGSPVYYVWRSTHEDLKELAANLKSEGMIEHTSEFLKLFSIPNCKLVVHFDSRHLDFIVRLFHELFKRNLVSYRGELGGKYVPLRRYGFDIKERTSLSNFDPRRINDRISKSKQRYKALERKVNLWVDPITVVQKINSTSKEVPY